MKQVDENRDWLIRRAWQGAPYEVCGFIMQDGSIIEIPNSSQDPITSFYMLRQHLVERVPNPNDIFAIWHSHPNGNGEPSEKDCLAIESGHVLPNWVYLIVTAAEIYHHDIAVQIPTG